MFVPGLVVMIQISTVTATTAEMVVAAEEGVAVEVMGEDEAEEGEVEEVEAADGIQVRVEVLDDRSSSCPWESRGH